MTSDGSRWVPCGSPLFLGEARYLQHALEEQGIRSRIRSDRNAGRRRDAVHSVLVRPADRDAALGVRVKALEEEEEGRPEEKRPAGRGSRSAAALLTAGVLGVATGARVGVKFRAAWVTPLAALFFGAFAVGATLLVMPGRTRGRAASERDSSSAARSGRKGA